ncbi:mCG148058 [Mus musculus]|nr:mCG148058 [Mus musculus]
MQDIQSSRQAVHLGEEDMATGREGRDTRRRRWLIRLHSNTGK